MSDAEKYWNDRLQKLRRFKGLCPLTPSEAEEALSKMRSRPASDAEIDAIVDAISRGVMPESSDEPPPADWSAEYDHEAIESEAVLFRNEGEGADEPDASENELLEELLGDDEDDANHMEG